MYRQSGVKNVIFICSGSLFLSLLMTRAIADVPPPTAQERMTEWTVRSQKVYSDPFNDVDVDVVFRRGDRTWRVPTFWRGGSEWTVRFAPPVPGEYTYHLESTDVANQDLNGHEGKVTITAYSGNNSLLKHGMLRVSADKHYFEYEDGTPFYWLGDTWWTGLSDRLPWEGFKRLTSDRKAKGFTVVQIVAGLIPPEELAPIDPGYRNEGGAVWDAQYKRINPKYFDFADRRIRYLLDQGLTPAIVGAWGPLVKMAGVEVLKKHWRYIIARYGAYPVLWIAGGEVYEPPEAVGRARPGYVLGGRLYDLRTPGWSEVVRYIRVTDPYHQPLSVHDMALIPSLPDESLTDYSLFQCGHDGWTVIPLELARLQKHEVDPGRIKPKVIGEIGYEHLGALNLENFQRAAFWLAMLNGAAGYTYGANATWESYTADKLIHRMKASFMTWEEGMKFPGSYEIGLGAKLLRQYPWWQFQPHQEWVSPRGDVFEDTSTEPPQAEPPAFGSSLIEKGNFFLPYAAGIPGNVRFVYIPVGGGTPTVLGLELNIRYRAYYWDPTLGIKFDLGAVQRPAPGALLRKEEVIRSELDDWKEYGDAETRKAGQIATDAEILNVLEGVSARDVVVAVDARSTTEAGLVVRFQDVNNYLAAVYSARGKTMYLFERKAGVNGPALARTPVPEMGVNIRLITEARGSTAAISISDGQHTVTTPIVDVEPKAGRVGILRRNGGNEQSYAHFEVREVPTLMTDTHLEKKLYDATGKFRGELRGSGLTLWPWGTAVSGWDDFGKEKHILLDAYRPQTLPYAQDWVLVLDASHQ